MTEIDLWSNYSRRMKWRKIFFKNDKKRRNPDLCPFDFGPKVDDCEESMRNSLEPERCDSSMEPPSAPVGAKRQAHHQFSDRSSFVSVIWRSSISTSFSFDIWFTFLPGSNKWVQSSHCELCGNAEKNQTILVAQTARSRSVKLRSSDQVTHVKTKLLILSTSLIGSRCIIHRVAFCWP